jgi:hypothetical protein
MNICDFCKKSLSNKYSLQRHLKGISCKLKIEKAIKNRLHREGRYTLELHKTIATSELIEHGYNQEVITDWLNSIEE